MPGDIKTIILLFKQYALVPIGTFPLYIILILDRPLSYSDYTNGYDIITFKIHFLYLKLSDAIPLVNGGSTSIKERF